MSSRGFTTDKALLERIREIMEGVTRGFEAGQRYSISLSEMNKLDEPLNCALNHVLGVENVKILSYQPGCVLIVVYMNDDTAATFKLHLRSASVTVALPGLHLQGTQVA